MYDQINDAMRQALGKEGYKGQVNEMLIAWLRSESAVGNDLMQLWHSFFNLKTIPPGQHNERMQGWLTSEGFKRETLADSILAYWKNRANTP